MKRILGVLVAMAAIGAAAASVRGVNLARQKAVMAHAESLGKSTLVAAERALARLHQRLEPAVGRAVAVPELRRLLSAHLSGDATVRDPSTLADRLAGAPWWAEARSGMPAYLIAVDGRLLLHNQDGAAAELPALATVAARQGRVSGFVFLAGRPWLAAADRIAVSGHQAVLVLAQALDDASLAALAPVLGGGTVLLADGQRLLARHGQDADALAARVSGAGFRPRAPVTRVVPIPDDRFEVTAGKALAAQLNLWVGTTTLPPENAVRTANLTRAAILAGAALIAILAVVLGHRRGDQRVGSRNWSPRDAT